ncbi:YolD-like family protein [Oceanobacillus sp. J11TS1]|uniref:YolD-like family protein n=1 Tax=Oceanobacillus sp. J11TS1 TaxID=2807191 RepID=UPI001B24E582|nr:YolD-like family protein [Oceanobacillus sp. J11TS1]GIO24094.1 hypothetical protein J11TS1_26750 [Oceanobacillus sp. J11TS1]
MRNIHDRGTMKWTSLMLPEQVELLKELRQQRERKEKPILDEDQLEYNGFSLMEAAKEEKMVWIKYFKDYDFHEVTGYVETLKPGDEVIKCTNDDGVQRIHYSNLIHVEII